MTRCFFFSKNSAFFSLLLAALLLSASANAQIIRRDTAKRVNNDTASLIEEKLVELAMEGPLVKAAGHQDKINEYQLTAARNSWVNLLTVSYNYNDQTFKNNAQNVYPKFFVGVTVPLGTLLSRTQVKAAKESVEISKENHEQLRRTIKAEVIGKYRQYKAFGEMIAMQSELLANVQAALLQAEDRFRKGTIKIDEYNTAQKVKNQEATNLVNLQLQQDLVKLDIEKMIGTGLESVIR